MIAVSLATMVCLQAGVRSRNVYRIKDNLAGSISLRLISIGGFRRPNLENHACCRQLESRGIVYVHVSRQSLLYALERKFIAEQR